MTVPTKITDEEILKSNTRKMDMFYAIDEAFYNTQVKFDKEGQSASFSEMYDAVNMLYYKIQALEIDARFAYHIATLEKPNVNLKSKTDGVT